MQTEPKGTNLIRFGVFEIDLASGELRMSGRRIKLQEQPFQVLAALLERPGEVVTREELRQRLWSDDTFVDFEHSLGTAIKKIRRALDDSATNPRFIETLPKRGYRFIAPVEGPSRSFPAKEAHQRPQREIREQRLSTSRLGWYTAAAAVLFAVAALALPRLFVSSDPEQPTEPMRVVPLTSYPGDENHVCFSPDGARVAFSWDGRDRDNHDIYVKEIGFDTVSRLTMDSSIDSHPAWSPDGRFIAFLRRKAVGVEPTVFLVPAVGGPERPVAEIAVSRAISFLRRDRFMGLLAWFPDSRHLVVADSSSSGDPTALVLLSVDTGTKKRLTSPPVGTVGDTGPAFSRDGRTLAFIRTTGLKGGDIYLLPFSEKLTPQGEPERLTFDNQWASSPAWTANGRGLVFSSAIGGLMRVPVLGSREPQSVATVGFGAIRPGISWDGQQLAFSDGGCDSNIWQLPLGRSGAGSSSPVRLTSTNRFDAAAQHSPDGKKIALESNRTGTFGIWLSDPDGSDAEPLFLHPDGAMSGTPRWSPDGDRIVFDSYPDGNGDIFVISAKGGDPFPLTNHPADDRAPSWSYDGRWVYFASARTGRDEVWKVSAAGGEPVQVTTNGGFEAFESPDGESLYFTKSHALITSLWTVPVGGGEETQVLDPIYFRNFSVSADGIYFMPVPALGEPDWVYEIRLFEFATGNMKMLASLPRGSQPRHGINVAPDGRSLLYSQIDDCSSDLMLVENFR